MKIKNSIYFIFFIAISVQYLQQALILI